MMQVGDIIGYQDGPDGTITLSYIDVVDGDTVRIGFTEFPPDDPNRDFAEDEKARLIASPPPPPSDAYLDAQAKERSQAEIDLERDRRITLGFTFNGVLYQFRPGDRENIAGSATAALGAMVNGAQANDLRWHGGTSDFTWIAADNTETPMDAQTMFALGQAAMAHKQAHIFAARALKDADPIPTDFQDDIHWP